MTNNDDIKQFQKTFLQKLQKTGFLIMTILKVLKGFLMMLLKEFLNGGTKKVPQ